MCNMSDVGLLVKTFETRTNIKNEDEEKVGRGMNDLGPELHDFDECVEVHSDPDGPVEEFDAEGFRGFSTCSSSSFNTTSGVSKY